MFDKLKWTKDANCQVCERRMPEGYHGYIGTGPGTHVVIVTWVPTPRAECRARSLE